MTDEEVALTRKESARRVLQRLLEEEPTRTIKQYMTYFKLWAVSSHALLSLYSIICVAIMPLT